MKHHGATTITDGLWRTLAGELKVMEARDKASLLDRLVITMGGLATVTGLELKGPWETSSAPQVGA